MLFVIGGLATFVLGGLTGVMVAMAPFDFQAHDTFFIVGHLHTVLIGGTIFPIVAGFYYFFPLVNGKKLSDRLGRIAFWLMFVGFNVTFLPMHLTGLRGMVRRVFTYPAGLGFDTLNLRLEHRRVHPRPRASWSFVWDVVRPKRQRAATRSGIRGAPARSNGSPRCRASRGACARFPRSTAAIRCGTSRTSCATWTRAASICRTPRRAGARRWSRRSIDAQPVQCLRARRQHVPAAARPRCSPAASSSSRRFTGGGWRSPARVLALGTHPDVALDRHGGDSGEADEGRRPRPDAAALRLGAGVGRLVGDVHHDAGRS